LAWRAGAAPDVLRLTRIAPANDQAGAIFFSSPVPFSSIVAPRRVDAWRSLA